MVVTPSQDNNSLFVCPFCDEIGKTTVLIKYTHETMDIAHCDVHGQLSVVRDSGGRIVRFVLNRGT